MNMCAKNGGADRHHFVDICEKPQVQTPPVLTRVKPINKKYTYFNPRPSLIYPLTFETSGLIFKIQTTLIAMLQLSGKT